MSTLGSTRKPALLDTELLIDDLRKHPSAAALFDKLPDVCAVSTLSVAELHAGVREGAERHALDTLLSTFAAIAIHADRVLLSLNAKHFPMLGKGRLVVPYTQP